MYVNELKKRLTLEMVVELVKYLGGEFNAEMETDEKMVMNTSICHGGESFKCDLYKDSLYFHCYSSCGNFSIMDLVQDVMRFETLQEAVDFICSYFNISVATKGFGRQKVEHKIKPLVKKEINFDEKLPEYDKYILNTFLSYHAIEWIYEGIKDETMTKYEILFDINSNGIIIPHRDIDNRLVGIRQRNLDKHQVVDLKRKYVPYTNYCMKLIYRHKLSMNLYGININKESITKLKMCILWESEKSVLKMDSIYNNNPSVAVGGSSVSEYQLHILKQLGCTSIYVAFDNEDIRDDKWNKKMKKIYSKILNFGFDCYIIRDYKQAYLSEKDSPIDKGKEVFEELWNNAKKYNLEE